MIQPQCVHCTGVCAGNECGRDEIVHEELVPGFAASSLVQHNPP